MTLKLGMWLWGLMLYIDFINDDPGLKGGLAQWLASQTTDQGVTGSRPGRVAIRCGLDEVTFRPCLVLVQPRNPSTSD